MALFKYRGRNQSRELVTGELEAVNADAVAVHLNRNQIIPIEIIPATGADGKLEIGRLLSRRKASIRLEDMVFFCSQMYTMLHAGVPIMDTLKGLHESTSSDALARAIGQLSEDLNAGLELSAAMRHQPETFTGLFWGLIELGEVSGNLPDSFRQLGVYIERERETRIKIHAAMRYPSIVIGAISVALLIINIFVIPVFANVFARFHAELPLITQILIAISNFIVHFWYVLAAMIVAVALGIRSYLRSAKGAYWWDHYKLKLPLVGIIFFHAALSRFAYTLAMTVRSGVPWSQSMAVVANAVGNRYLAEQVTRMRTEVESGTSITQTAAASGLFPRTVLQMLRVGEMTGDLDRLLTEVAAYYDREIEYRLKMLSSVIEPVLIVAVGVIVLLLALGVFLPMWGLGQAALGR